ncbi:endonuclease domain-containing protein [Brevibacterium spongiae]|uniref:Endonuclease domain-containing protein n=1 Tax=Brevibacterium spongiae TaxID=2909672 RepID=A0ABY5SNQ9_9MICO|nr:hypothetical protein [Brevibacterium spongiae]UVI35935.1 endonuclease domain-containing protein [Brevibacterium spongiae]
MDNQASAPQSLDPAQRTARQRSKRTGPRRVERTDPLAKAAGESTAPPELRVEPSSRKLRVRPWMDKPRQLMTAAVPFTRAQGVSRGITRRALDDEQKYRQLGYGVWVETAPTTLVVAPTWADSEWVEERVKLSGLVCVDPDIVACNVTAARLYGLPVPWNADTRVHVAREDNGLSKHRKNVAFHRYEWLRSENFFGLPIITAAQLFIELARVLTVGQLVELGDAAVGRWHGGPLTTIDEIRAELVSRRRVKGRLTAERALGLVRDDVDSPPETRLRLHLIDAGLPEPVVHPAITCSLIGTQLHPDMGYPSIKLAIEYEGDHHRSSPAQFAEDNRRISALQAEGWTVIRVSKGSDMAEIRRLIAHKLRAGGLI